MLDRDLLTSIRAIFLHDGQPVTPEEAARLLGWSLDDMDALIKWREVDVAGTSAGPRIARSELVAHALRQWPLSLVQGAIGSQSVAVARPAVHYAEVAL
jgi:hypothetical protein